MSKTGDCVVKHPGGFATGMALVVRIGRDGGTDSKGTGRDGGTPDPVGPGGFATGMTLVVRVTS